MLNEVKFKIKPINSKPGLKASRFNKYLKYFGITVVTLTLTFLVYQSEQSGQWFKASILDLPQPFNGTVPPVYQVPNWVTWGGDIHSTNFTSVSESNLIDLPPYDLNKMAFNNDNLVWDNADHDLIRNIKITYPVVYMGNYEYDHIENSGSHLAVDIRIPIDTPIHAIANGKVYKTSMQSSGFGHHIVIKHFDVPDPSNPDKTTILYSSYVHLNNINVSEGQNVVKGEKIATSGNTGTSTSPHLHFQIDNDSAPWHPYWPFTSTEASAAGLSFFSAVNAGLGKSSAIATTINPMEYVNNNIGALHLVSDQPGGTEVPDNSPDVEVIDNPFVEPDPIDDPILDPVVVPIISPDIKVDTSLFEFELSGASQSMIGNGVTITATDTTNQISQLDSSDHIDVEVSGVGNVRKSSYTKSNFNSGTIKIILISEDPGISNIMIGKSSFQVSFLNAVKYASALEIEHDGHFSKNIVETITIKAVDEDGIFTPSINFPGKVQLTSKLGQANFNPDTLTSNDFKNGIATVRFQSSVTDSIVVRAQNGALVGESSKLRHESRDAFTDIKMAHPNFEAIKFLKDKDVISGYPDGSFQPNKSVNRVEALKMLALAFDLHMTGGTRLPFSDTDSKAWYASTLRSAYDAEIVGGYSDGTFKPGRTVNKAEYLKILFKSSGIKITSTITSNPYNDVSKDAWFAPYAYMLNKKNILDYGNNLYPSDGMTRAEVAESIYRLKYIQDNNFLSYSK